MEGVWEEGVGCGIGCWICGSGVLGSVVGDAMIKIRLRIDGSYGKILERERRHFYGERPISYYKSFYCSIF